MKSILFYFFVIITCGSYGQILSPWKLLPESVNNKVNKLSDKDKYLSDYKLFRLDLNLLTSKLESNKDEYFMLDIPNSPGKLNTFKVFESSIMHPILQNKYSNIKTYKGVGVDDPTATIRFSLSPLGFHALSSSGTRSTLYIEPYSKSDDSIYIIFEKESVYGYESDFECFTEQNIPSSNEQRRSSFVNGQGDIDDQKLRTYRLALSCTGEYAQIFAGSGTVENQKANVLAAMITSINRVNDIYERDFGIRLELVANNDQIIYLDPFNDPWQGEFNTTTASTLDQVIGVNNYDIGHNYNDTGGGNAGCLGCVCASNSQNSFHKGRGWTGSSNPIGDPFYIDYVAHEMGHQFYGFHTMNSCSRSGFNTEVEPGSGSSIMGYAGICPPNVQNNSDAHFNYVNIRDIGGYIKTGLNSYYGFIVPTCDVGLDIQNQPPTANAGNDYIIPTNTPFVLTGIADDPDGNETLTYNWSQNDTEQSPQNSAPQSNWQTGPLYRSLSQTNDPERYFPKLETVVSGSLSSTWEVTPSVPRILNFALTVRDNGSGFIGDDGTGQVATDEMLVTVVDTGSGFSVTSQDESDLMWQSGSVETVSWNVAGTDANGINADEVDIILSTDGGVSFNEVLAQGVPNDGSHDVLVPNTPALNCRLMVRGNNHIFYAVNTIPFTIDYIAQTNCITYSSAENLAQNIPDGAGQNVFGDFLVNTIDVTENGIISDVNFNVDITHPWIEDLNIVLQHPDETQSVLFDRDCTDEDNLDVTFDDEAPSDFICEVRNGVIYKPTGTSLSNFDGKNSQGQWIIGIRDFYNEDLGILNDYTLEICTTTFILNAPSYDLSAIKFYPNPVENTLFIDTFLQDLTYSLLDLRGRKIYTTKGKFLPMDKLSNGVYIVKITGNNQTFYKRIIKK